MKSCIDDQTKPESKKFFRNDNKPLLGKFSELEITFKSNYNKLGNITTKKTENRMKIDTGFNNTHHLKPNFTNRDYKPRAMYPKINERKNLNPNIFPNSLTHNHSVPKLNPNFSIVIPLNLSKEN